MYNVSSMKIELDNAVQVVSDRIRDEFEHAFRSIYADDQVPEKLSFSEHEICFASVEKEADLKAISAGAGLYIILTDHPVDGNGCRLASGELRAVYRGECSLVRLRVMSHLFNARYQANHETAAEQYTQDARFAGKSYYKEAWPHCIKLTPSGPSGINVDRDPYFSFRWLVVTHSMRGSSQAVRQLAEHAFDRAFGHPAASRERSRT